MAMHDPDEPCFAEEFMAKIMPALIRMGDIRESSILKLADQCEGEARHVLSVGEEEKLKDMARILRAWTIEADGPPPSDWLADKRRSKLRLIAPD